MHPRMHTAVSNSGAALHVTPDPALVVPLASPGNPQWQIDLENLPRGCDLENLKINLLFWTAKALLDRVA